MRDLLELGIVQLRRPQFFPMEGTPEIICVPIFDKKEKIKSRRQTAYVLEFELVRGLPAGQVKTIYIHPALIKGKVPPSSVDIEQARRQAYAVCRAESERRASGKNKFTRCNKCLKVLEDNSPEAMARHKQETGHRMFTQFEK